MYISYFIYKYIYVTMRARSGDSGQLGAWDSGGLWELHPLQKEQCVS